MSDQPTAQPASAGKWTREAIRHVPENMEDGHVSGRCPTLVLSDGREVADLMRQASRGRCEVAEANAQRLCDCWNACLSIHDPAAALALAREALTKAADEPHSDSCTYIRRWRACESPKEIECDCFRRDVAAALVALGSEAPPTL